MKNLILLACLAVFGMACNSDSAKKNETIAETATQQTHEVALNGDKQVDLAVSKIYWKGYKILGNHTGTIDLTGGKMTFNNGDIVGGSFIADMKTVKVTELIDEDGEEDASEDKSDLANHLMNEDFFDAEKFPTSTFAITSATRNGNKYDIVGNMTIKEVTKEIKFQSELVDNTFKAEIPVNRTDFGIKYGSGTFFSDLGDNIIKDNFDLVVKLVLK